MIWRLLDCVQHGATFPNTFKVPTVSDMSCIGPGDHVKLIFQFDKPHMGVESERMWVRVTLRCGDSFTGTIANYPLFLKDELEYGGVVHFSLRHIAMVDRSCDE